MALLNADITLLIAEQMDVASIRSLMLPCRANYALLKAYEQSIAKAQISRLIADRALRPLTRPILRSANPDGPLLQPLTYNAVQELEYRAATIERLLVPGHPFFTPVLHIGLHARLTRTQTARLVDRVRHTCQLVDRMADCGAYFRHTDPPPRPTNWDTDPDDADWDALEDAPTHLARQAFLAGLCALDVACLELLVVCVGTAYLGGAVVARPAVDDVAAQVLGVQEVYLQRGSVALEVFLPEEDEEEEEEEGQQGQDGEEEGANSDDAAAAAAAQAEAEAAAEAAAARTARLRAMLDRLLGQVMGRMWAWGSGLDGVLQPLRHCLWEAFPEEEVMEEIVRVAEEEQQVEAVEGEEIGGEGKGEGGVADGDADGEVGDGWMFQIDVWDDDDDDGVGDGGLDPR